MNRARDAKYGLSNCMGDTTRGRRAPFAAGPDGSCASVQARQAASIFGRGCRAAAAAARGRIWGAAGGCWRDVFSRAPRRAAAAAAPGRICGAPRGLLGRLLFCARRPPPPPPPPGRASGGLPWGCWGGVFSRAPRRAAAAAPVGAFRGGPTGAAGAAVFFVLRPPPPPPPPVGVFGGLLWGCWGGCVFARAAARRPCRPRGRVSVGAHGGCWGGCFFVRRPAPPPPPPVPASGGLLWGCWSGCVFARAPARRRCRHRGRVSEGAHGGCWGGCFFRAQAAAAATAALGAFEGLLWGCWGGCFFARAAARRRCRCPRPRLGGPMGPAGAAVFFVRRPLPPPPPPVGAFRGLLGGCQGGVFARAAAGRRCRRPQARSRAPWGAAGVAVAACGRTLGAPGVPFRRRGLHPPAGAAATATRGYVREAPGGLVRRLGFAHTVARRRCCRPRARFGGLWGTGWAAVSCVRRPAPPAPPPAAAFGDPLGCLWGGCFSRAPRRAAAAAARGHISEALGVLLGWHSLSCALPRAAAATACGHGRGPSGGLCCARSFIAEWPAPKPGSPPPAGAFTGSRMAVVWGVSLRRSPRVLLWW